MKRFIIAILALMVMVTGASAEIVAVPPGPATSEFNAAKRPPAKDIVGYGYADRTIVSAGMTKDQVRAEVRSILKSELRGLATKKDLGKIREKLDGAKGKPGMQQRLREIEEALNGNADSAGVIDTQSALAGKIAEVGQTANEALATAKSAKSTADTAKTTAETAQTTANGADTFCKILGGLALLIMLVVAALAIFVFFNRHNKATQQQLHDSELSKTKLEADRACKERDELRREMDERMRLNEEQARRDLNVGSTVVEKTETAKREEVQSGLGTDRVAEETTVREEVTT